MRHLEFVMYKYFCRLSFGRSFISLCGISGQEGYGEIFSRAARSQSPEYLNFWRLVSRQIDSSLCEMQLSVSLFLHRKKRGDILQIGTVE